MGKTVKYSNRLKVLTTTIDRITHFYTEKYIDKNYAQTLKKNYFW